MRLEVGGRRDWLFMGLVGHAETFRLGPLGSGRPSDGCEQESDSNPALQGLVWMQGAVQAPGAESA